MDPVLSHHISQERQSAAVPELLNNKPHQTPKQSHAEDHTEQIEATSKGDHRQRTGRLQSRKEYHRKIQAMEIIIVKVLTTSVVGAPQMILQPVFSIFPCSPLPSGTC